MAKEISKKMSEMNVDEQLNEKATTEDAQMLDTNSSSDEDNEDAVAEGPMDFGPPGMYVPQGMFGQPGMYGPPSMMGGPMGHGPVGYGQMGHGPMGGSPMVGLAPPMYEPRMRRHPRRFGGPWAGMPGQEGAVCVSSDEEAKAAQDGSKEPKKNRDNSEHQEAAAKSQAGRHPAMSHPAAYWHFVMMRHHKRAMKQILRQVKSGKRGNKGQGQGGHGKKSGRHEKGWSQQKEQKEPSANQKKQA